MSAPSRPGRRARALEVEVVDFSPSTLDHVLACISALGWSAWRRGRGRRAHRRHAQPPRSGARGAGRGRHVSACLHLGVARPAFRSRPLGSGHGRRRRGNRGRGDRRRALAPDALDRRGRAGAGRRRPRSLWVRPRPDAVRDRDAGPLRGPARHEPPARKAASSPSTRTPTSRARDRDSSTASSCSPTCSIRRRTRIREFPGAASGCALETSPDFRVAKLGGIDASRLVAEEAGSRLEVELPVVVGAGQRGAEDLSLHSGLPSCGQVFATACALPSTRKTAISSPVPSTTARPSASRLGERDPQPLHAA